LTLIIVLVATVILNRSSRPTKSSKPKSPDTKGIKTTPKRTPSFVVAPGGDERPGSGLKDPKKPDRTKLLSRAKTFRARQNSTYSDLEKGRRRSLEVTPSPAYLLSSYEANNESTHSLHQVLTRRNSLGSTHRGNGLRRSSLGSVHHNNAAIRSSSTDRSSSTKRSHIPRYHI
jgi:hypothetical protein